MSIKTIAFLGLAVWNLAVFITYGIDKSRARRGVWRISEKTLLLESLCLGGIGSLFAGQFFRHKIRKPYFWLAWLVGLLTDIIVIYIFWRI
ncbi:DUF1294 domain-containing protein [Streptococcus devriesei]|uniref:DUF1294 domain-containing protein n=1 Tax=Streptococcus devriesei TaxID=231233 RepID=UPI000569FC8D|nr:DUF1294 domain-containing protein [Streptococcus devriesei]